MIGAIISGSARQTWRDHSQSVYFKRIVKTNLYYEETLVLLEHQSRTGFISARPSFIGHYGDTQRPDMFQVLLKKNKTFKYHFLIVLWSSIVLFLILIFTKSCSELSYLCSSMYTFWSSNQDLYLKTNVYANKRDFCTTIGFHQHFLSLQHFKIIHCTCSLNPIH